MSMNRSISLSKKYNEHLNEKKYRNKMLFYFMETRKDSSKKFEKLSSHCYT